MNITRLVEPAGRTLWLFAFFFMWILIQLETQKVKLAFGVRVFAF